MKHTGCLVDICPSRCRSDLDISLLQRSIVLYGVLFDASLGNGQNRRRSDSFLFYRRRDLLLSRLYGVRLDEHCVSSCIVAVVALPRIVPIVAVIVVEGTITGFGSVIPTTIVVVARALGSLVVVLVCGIVNSGARIVAFGAIAPPVHPSAFASTWRVSSPLRVLLRLVVRLSSAS